MILVCCVLLSLSAKAQQTFSLFPKAGDKYWQKQVLVAMRNDYIRLGNLYQKKPWNAIPAETFAEFRTNGNRTRYEEASYIYKVETAAQKKMFHSADYVFMADMWNPKHLSDSRHLWVSISWENGAPVLKNDKKHGRSARFLIILITFAA